MRDDPVVWGYENDPYSLFILFFSCFWPSGLLEAQSKYIFQPLFISICITSSSGKSVARGESSGIGCAARKSAKMVP